MIGCILWLAAGVAGIIYAIHACTKSRLDPIAVMCKEAEIGALTARARELRRQTIQQSGWHTDRLAQQLNEAEADLLTRRADKVTHSLIADAVVIRLAIGAAALWAFMCGIFAMFSLTG